MEKGGPGAAIFPACAGSCAGELRNFAKSTAS